MIEGFDAALSSLLLLDRPRRYTVVFRHPAFAQKQAQALWNYLAQMQRLDWCRQIRFSTGSAYQEGQDAEYDGLYAWLPFSEWPLHELLRHRLAQAYRTVAPAALAFIVGPPDLPALAQAAGWTVQTIQPVMELPTFRMHRHILPKARLKSGMTLCQMTRATA